MPPDWAALRTSWPAGWCCPTTPATTAAAQVVQPAVRRPPAGRGRALPRPRGRAGLRGGRARRRGCRSRRAAGGHSYAGYSNPDGGADRRPRPRWPRCGVDGGTAVVGAGARLDRRLRRRSAVAGPLPAGRVLPDGRHRRADARRRHRRADPQVRPDLRPADARRRSSRPTATLRHRVARTPSRTCSGRCAAGAAATSASSPRSPSTPSPRPTSPCSRCASRPARRPDVLGAWQDWIAGAPDELWSNCVVSGGLAADRAGRRLLRRLDGGVRAAAARLRLDRVLAVGHRQGLPGRHAVLRRAARSAASSSAARLRRAAAAAGSRSWPRRGCSASRSPTRPPWSRCSTAGPASTCCSTRSAARCPGWTPGATAFPHRGALASAQIYAGTGAGDQAAARRWARSATGSARSPARPGTSTTSTRPCRTGRTRTTATTSPGCARSPTRYDPDGVFAFAQGLTARDR